MADHYFKAVDLLDEVEQNRLRLQQAYKAKASPAVISQLHHDIRTDLALAKVHAQLATAQRTGEVSSAVEHAWVRP